MKTLSLIFAVSHNGVIGDKGALPWHLQGDLKHFKELTQNHTIIMGRKTFESIGRPLPERQNIILTSQRGYEMAGCEVVHSLDDALTIAQSDEVFIIGGEALFNQTLAQADKLYVTEVHATIPGDTHFTPDYTQWLEVTRESHHADEKNDYGYTFIEYERE